MSHPLFEGQRAVGRVTDHYCRQGVAIGISVITQYTGGGYRKRGIFDW